MLAFVGRRFLFVFAVAVFIVYAVSLGMRMVPNSELPEPDFDMVSHSAGAWADTEAFFSRLARGETVEIATGSGTTPLWTAVRTAYVNSMALLGIALLVAAVLGLWLGVVAARSRVAGLSLGFLTLTTIGISVPSFFAALLLQQWAIAYLNQTGTRLVSVAGFGWDLDHMLLPLIVLALRPLATITRTTFVSFKGVEQSDFMRTAYAKGLRQRRAVWLHALKNVAVPVLTAVGVSLRFSLTALPVVELFFAWPGMGMALITAINERNVSLVVALAFALGLTLLLVNLALDVAYRRLDPRLSEDTA